MEPNIYQDSKNVHQLYPAGTEKVYSRDSWGVMLEKLSGDMKNLWERQLQLIVTELNEKSTVFKAASGAMAIGGSLMFVGVFCLAATAILGLSIFFAPWIASAIVTFALLFIGFVMVKTAQRKISGRRLVPTQSIEALGEMKNTFQERIHEFKR